MTKAALLLLKSQGNRASYETRLGFSRQLLGNPI